MAKPSIPQGTRDFGPETVRKRNYILRTIREVFELYGFQPLETPAMENLETLMGKYGDEGDKLIFRVLNNGLDNPGKEARFRQDFEMLLKGKNVPGLTERALKYDLTIPFARYVAMNHNQLTFPFRRYQVQPVWRADRPQKGRYREFLQCDADIVGSRSLLNETELALIYREVFTRLGMEGTTVRLNHRQILAGLAELCGGQQFMVAITTAIDKLDKTGKEKVLAELAGKGLNPGQAGLVSKYLDISGSNTEILDGLTTLIGETPSGKQGIAELRQVMDSLRDDTTFSADPTLARGLNYYTGIIFEVKAPPSVGIGSIGGGGRYDDLTGLFGVPGIPGVGISFGVDRIYDVMEELGLFPANLQVSTRVLFFNLGEAESRNAFTLMQSLRQKGISAELYHESVKMDKQFRYAEKKNIPWVVIIGSKEMAENTCTVKNLAESSQQTIPQGDLFHYPFG